MTAMEIYWIMQADKFIEGAIALGIILAALGLALFVAGLETRFCRWVTAGFVATTLACTLCFVFVTFAPTTKTLCAMYVVPQIVSEENIDTVSGDMAEIYELGIERLKDAISEDDQ